MSNAAVSPVRSSRKKLGALALIVLVLVGFVVWQAWQLRAPDNPITVLTREGVLQRIQHLNNLETVAFHVETVVTSTKQGSWYRLWQDQQRGLFIASGRVVAGLNLNRLTADQVQVSADGKMIHIDLPPVEMLSISLDKTEIYDLNTGLMGLMKIDPELLTQAQQAARVQIGQSACQSGVLRMANENAQKQVQALFALTQAQVSVTAAPVPSCRT
ncbi:MAG: DUF4230 domain-containing protein [Pseudomonadota bacterium]|nr:DUF4230 domain-containing protein [Pseudomonadota bacterium]